MDVGSGMQTMGWGVQPHHRHQEPLCGFAYLQTSSISVPTGSGTADPTHACHISWCVLVYSEVEQAAQGREGGEHHLCSESSGAGRNKMIFS